MDKEEKLTELAKQSCSQLQSICSIIEDNDIPPLFMDYFLQSMQDESTVMKMLKKDISSSIDSSIYRLATMSTMQKNILGKIRFSLSHDFLNDKKQLMVAKFASLDKTMLEQNEGDKYIEEFVRKQDIYYPQLLENENYLGVTEFKIVDPDAFNQLLDK